MQIVAETSRFDIIKGFVCIELLSAHESSQRAGHLASWSSGDPRFSIIVEY